MDLEDRIQRLTEELDAAYREKIVRDRKSLIEYVLRMRAEKRLVFNIVDALSPFYQNPPDGQLLIYIGRLSISRSEIDCIFTGSRVRHLESNLGMDAIIYTSDESVIEWYREECRKPENNLYTRLLSTFADYRMDSSTFKVSYPWLVTERDIRIAILSKEKERSKVRCVYPGEYKVTRF